MTKEEAIQWAGGHTDLAERLGITSSAVSQWTEVPELQQYRLHTLSAGHLPIDDKFKVQPRSQQEKQA